MNTGEDRSLNAKNILSRISDYDIYRYYLGYDFQYRKNYLSPFRSSDTRPSFAIMVLRSGQLYHSDFGDSSYKGNCFHFVQQLYGLNFNQALIKINKDFGLGLMGSGNNGSNHYQDIVKQYQEPEKVEFGEPSEVKIHVIPKSFSCEELKYWSEYGINQDDLKEEKIFSIDKLYVNGKFISNYNNEMKFAYLFEDGDESFIKVYSPFSKEYKWISNVPIKRALNLDQLPREGETILITKSKKDKIVLKKLYPEIYEAQKEGTECITEELDNFFEEWYKYKICFFDNDEPGKKANRLLNPKGYGWINIPNQYNEVGVKDPSDLVKYYGIEKGYDVLRGLLVQKGIIKLEGEVYECRSS